MFQSTESRKANPKQKWSIPIINNPQWDLIDGGKFKCHGILPMWILQKFDNRSPHPLYAVETCYLPTTANYMNDLLPYFIFPWLYDSSKPLSLYKKMSLSKCYSEIENAWWAPIWAQANQTQLSESLLQFQL